MYERLELYIETLTGAAFELRVSPYETVQDIKARIQKLEGIPISQQHLIWQTTELDDECCLSDYSIQDGATLKLVLTMRGGPINTRRIPMDDPTLREMAEYLTEANKEEILEKVSNRPVTVIVYHNGDQFNFFRVVDREATSPLSESLSGASMYNLYDEDDEEEEEQDSPSEEKHEENHKTREKMKLLRSKMESLTLNKKHVKKKLVPRPPSSSRPSSKSRLRRLPSYSGSKKSASLNRNKCLPPVGRTLQESEFDESALPDSDGPSEGTDLAQGGASNVQAAKDSFHSATAAATGSSAIDRVGLGIRRLESVESAKLKPGLSSVKEDQAARLDEEDGVLPTKASPSGSNQQTDNCDTSSSDNIKKDLSKEAILRRAQSSLKASPKWDFSPEVLLKDPPKPSSPRCREAVAFRPDTSSIKGLERLLENTDIEGIAPLRPIPPTQGPSQGKALRDGAVPAGGSKEHVRVGSTSRHSLERLHSGGMVLESLHPSEVRAMSGMLSSLVRSASKSRAGYTLNGSAYKEVARIPTPEGRLVSARLQRLSASRDGHVMSPTHRLPPVKAKKKSKRCHFCDKKTGLANSYPCRCNHNFCATHRYPEAHNCTFDYKTEGRKLLEQNNPVVSAPKLPKI